MVFTKLFYTTIFLVLREFLYNTLIHLVIRSLFQEISVVNLQRYALKEALPVLHNAFIARCL
jgi:hypothetical protein